MKDCADPAYLTEYASAYPDSTHLVRLAESFIDACGGIWPFSDLVAKTLRRAYDEVIDMPRTGRWSLQQLEKTEKTYVGTKVEILLRHAFELPRGARLDLSVDGTEVDVKHTLFSTWTIPQEALGEVCLVLRGNDVSATFSAGLLWAREEHLTKGRNRDGKVTVSAGKGMASILWLVNEGPLIPNIFEGMGPDLRAKILNPRIGGTRRLVEFFTHFRNQPVHRDVVLAIAQQKDPMKRVRGNGGARDLLEQQGLLLLSTKFDGPEIATRGLTVAPDHFICVEASPPLMATRLASASSPKLQ